MGEQVNHVELCRSVALFECKIGKLTGDIHLRVLVTSQNVGICADIVVHLWRQVKVHRFIPNLGLTLGQIEASARITL